MVIDKTMSINDVLSMDRGSAAVMFAFGMGCLGCPHAMMESLEMACAAHGVDADDLVVALNKYFADKEKEAK